MYSDDGNWCSHQLGFPIRKSPDHSLLAASRGLSQLTTSFFAYLRQGIHTHALSSLTIKSTSHTNTFLRYHGLYPVSVRERYFFALILVFIMPVNIQLSKISIASAISVKRVSIRLQPLLICQLLCRLSWWAWVESNHRPHPYQGCALAI